MRFFHLSDLHIGLKLFNRDLREDQEYILAKIVEYAKQYRPDAVVVAGDIYDKAVPSAEAVEVFDHFVADLSRALPEAVIMIISGNHDSAARVNCFRSVLSRQNLYLVGQPPRMQGEQIEKVTIRDEHGNVNFYLLPFVKPSMVRALVGMDEDGSSLSYDAAIHRLLEREEIEEGERNVLVSHQFYLPRGMNAEEVERMDSEVRTVGNIDEVSADVLERFDYAALGHIHKPMTVGKEVYRYCGTPLACSVSEAGQEKGIVLVELGAKEDAGDGKLMTKTLVRVLPLVPLREVRVIKGRLQEVLKQASGDYVSIHLTDPADLEDDCLPERLRLAFPYLLEVRREEVRRADYSMDLQVEALADPFSLCCAFLKDLDDAEKEILRDVINTVQEGKIK